MNIASLLNFSFYSIQDPIAGNGIASNNLKYFLTGMPKGLFPSRFLILGVENIKHHNSLLIILSLVFEIVEREFNRT